MLIETCFTANAVPVRSSRYVCSQPRAYTRKDQCVIADVLSCGLEDPSRVSLVLHMSADRFDAEQIRKQLQNWKGPISLGIAFPRWTKFGSPQLLRVWRELEALQTEVANSKWSLSVHFLLTRYTNCNDGDVEVIKRRLKTPSVLSGTWPRSKPRFSACKGSCVKTNAHMMHSYPVNTIRNIARENSKTDFILIGDMEHYFSDGFEKKMAKLAGETFANDPKTVLVYRIFEVEEAPIEPPLSNDDLFRMFRARTATVFHTEHDGHKIDGLAEWFAHSNETADIQLYLPYDRREWEPQFVSRRDIPLHDETFSYPQRDNTVLRWEMCRAGYKWAVVHDVFMYHPVAKVKKVNNPLEVARELSLKTYDDKLSAFLNRMDRLYPETYHKCPQVASASEIDLTIRSY
ncbi:unnamed protein product [Bursaphelenchus xylophilus]|uniref:(pine wood nematode) hypothetical protein n=1 Tax=Bursaphelenchus xylophilus TaxID=6326 RepID=A0A1I7RQC1_BURXY|nr:unnamed protein product [Bursaphelenchus xylophilus]CAG9104336.1 unnamed protein product [Bursaphelenchus xylophilus]